MDVNSLQTVYYSGPIPRSKAALTLLGLVFDRIHFPNVYLPADGVDFDAVEAECRRIEREVRAPHRASILLGALRSLKHQKHLREFCVFTGHEGQIFGGELQAAADLRTQLERALFGEPPPGFIPTVQKGVHKGLPGGGYVDYPDPLHYMANAMVYAAKSGIPLSNDAPRLPILPVDGEQLHAQGVAGVLALKCVELALPIIPPLTPEQIVSLRYELRPHLRGLRSAVARLATTLTVMIERGDEHHDVQRKAKVLVDTEVATSLSDLHAALKKPKVFTLENTMTAVTAVPAVLAAATSSLPGAVAAALATFGALGVKVNRDIKQPQQSGLYYLVKLAESARR